MQKAKILLSFGFPDDPKSTTAYRGEDGMTFKSAIVAIGVIFFDSEAVAADASKPDAASVMNAMYAAVGVGNVDAAVSFFADDGYNIGPSGKKTTGKQKLRSLINGGWISENLQMGRAHDVKFRDDQTIMHFDV